MSGLILQAFVGPSPVYCPSPVSMKYIGIPSKSNMMTYGTRNAPKNAYNAVVKGCKSIEKYIEPTV